MTLRIVAIIVGLTLLTGCQSFTNWKNSQSSAGMHNSVISFFQY